MVYVERAKVRVAVRHRMDCCLLMAAAPCSAQCPSQLGTVGRSVLGENEREREQRQIDGGFRLGHVTVRTTIQLGNKSGGSNG